MQDGLEVLDPALPIGYSSMVDDCRIADLIDEVDLASSDDLVEKALDDRLVFVDPHGASLLDHECCIEGHRTLKADCRRPGRYLDRSRFATKPSRTHGTDEGADDAAGIVVEPRVVSPIAGWATFWFSGRRLL